MNSPKTLRIPNIQNIDNFLDPTEMVQYHPNWKKGCCHFTCYNKQDSTTTQLMALLITSFLSRAFLPRQASVPDYDIFCQASFQEEDLCCSVLHITLSIHRRNRVPV